MYGSERARVVRLPRATHLVILHEDRAIVEKATEQVAQWLGLVDPAVMARYRRVLYSPVDEVE